MTIFRTFTDAERAALKLHGLDTHRPSQLSDAFVIGMRYMVNGTTEVLQQARDALAQVTTSETFYRDPRGDNAGPAIDALDAALGAKGTA